MRRDERPAILVIRLSALGDILHTLPAVISIRQSFPSYRVMWLIAPKWRELVEGNPHVDEFIYIDRRMPFASMRAIRHLRELRPEIAFDFQGLAQSALLGKLARPQKLFGFDKSVAREPLASHLYTDRISVTGPHRIERNVQLAAAAGATHITFNTWIPQGQPESRLPDMPFVLASPFAGWAGKEWPLEHYESVGRMLKANGLQLVLNISPTQVASVRHLNEVYVHTSGLGGLIAATRNATAVLGVDSGPLHLAAALNKPGVALFGPTDPYRTGPFGGTMAIVRASDIETTYKRHKTIHPTMRLIRPEQVLDALMQTVEQRVRQSSSATTTFS